MTTRTFIHSASKGYAFLCGMAKVLDIAPARIGGSLHRRAPSTSQALGQDFERVGGYLRSAMSQYEESDGNENAQPAETAQQLELFR